MLYCAHEVHLHSERSVLYYVLQKKPWNVQTLLHEHINNYQVTITDIISCIPYFIISV